MPREARARVICRSAAAGAGARQATQSSVRHACAAERSALLARRPTRRTAGHAVTRPHAVRAQLALHSTASASWPPPLVYRSICSCECSCALLRRLTGARRARACGPQEWAPASSWIRHHRLLTPPGKTQAHMKRCAPRSPPRGRGASHARGVSAGQRDRTRPGAPGLRCTGGSAPFSPGSLGRVVESGPTGIQRRHRDTRTPAARHAHGIRRMRDPCQLGAREPARAIDCAHPVMRAERSTSARGARVLDKPVEGDVDVGLVLSRNGVAAHLAPRDLLETQLLDELVRGERARQVVLVAEHKERDAHERGLGDEVMELAGGAGDVLVVRGVHDVHHGVHPPAIPFPHGPKARLPAEVPQFDRHLAPSNLTHVEADRRDHALRKRAGSDDVDQCGLARVLQADERKLHLLLEEQASQPVQQSLP
mmetsp:Transcript_13739/g.46433  ORF Transcript_13739/g.46433 Transcript_13739/m.46433 type:complete len:424 (+) Transcript_13739:114-1385(+)